MGTVSAIREGLPRASARAIERERGGLRPHPLSSADRFD